MRPMGCASPGCGRAAITRGCCYRHYRRLYTLVRAGEAPCEQLEAPRGVPAGAPRRAPPHSGRAGANSRRVTIMTPGDFVEALEAELRLRGACHDRRALQEFVASARPLIEEDPNVRRWAAEFVAREWRGDAGTNYRHVGPALQGGFICDMC